MMSAVKASWNTASRGTITDPSGWGAMARPVIRSTATASANGCSGGGVTASSSPSSKSTHLVIDVSHRSIDPHTSPRSTRNSGSSACTLAVSSPRAPIENGPAWISPPTRISPSKYRGLNWIPACASAKASRYSNPLTPHTISIRAPAPMQVPTSRAVVQPATLDCR